MRTRGLLAVTAAILLAGAPTAHATTRAPVTNPAAGAVGTLRPAGDRLVDATGRTVVVHGLQVAHKTVPYHPPVTSFTDRDARRIARWGFNAVRLAWFWKGLEPQRGTYDDAYAREILREARLLQRRGVMVQLEAHQDVYNEALHGAGFPDWATFTDGVPVLPATPGLDNVAPATARAFDNLYADRDGIGAAFASAWERMARTFAADPPRLGYDLFNEPYPGSAELGCFNPVGCPSFDRGTLGPFEDRLAAAVRRVDEHSLVFYEPHVAFDFGAASSLPAPSRAAGPAAFAFHDYCLAAIGTGQPDHESSAPAYPSCEPVDTTVFANAAATAKAMGVPRLFNEFGDTQDRADIRRMMDHADADRLGWLYWGYKDWVDVPGGLGSGALFDNSDDDRTLRLAKLRTLSEPYPQATAGVPLAYRFDPAGRTFSFRYRPDPAVTAPTVVFTAPLQYPDGYVASVRGARIVSRRDAPKLVLDATPGATEVAVTLVPRAPATSARAVAARAKRPAAQPSQPRYGTLTRTNQAITMADGTVLRANVTVPADPTTGKAASGRFPVVLTETAYGKDNATYAGGFTGLLGRPDYYARRGYVAVIVDVRGTGASEGQWTFNDPQEAKDSVEVIRWAAALPASDGRVGMVGASYLGITQLFAAAAVGPGSPLKAIFPMIASNSIFREAVMPGGLLDAEGIAMYLGLTAGLNVANPLIASQGDPSVWAAPLADHIAGLLQFHVGVSAEALADGPRAEDGEFWRARGPERILDRIVANHIPAYLVGGLDDAFQSGVFRNFVGLQNAWSGRTTTLPMAARQQVTGRYQALVGPWFHAGIGKGGPDLDALALRWFDRWLKHVPNGIDRSATPLHVIERDRRTRELARWPLPSAPPRAFALTPTGGLTTAAADAGTTTVAFTGASMPCNRSTEIWLLGLGEAVTDALGVQEPCRDSSELGRLPAPASQEFTTEPLDAPLTIAGPITASLLIRSSTPDAELVAKLFDVDERGAERELTMGALLGSARATDPALSWRGANGLLIYPHHPITHAASRPLVPGRSERLDIEVLPTVHTLLPGHRLRLRLTGGEFPARFPLPDRLPDLLGGVYTVQLGTGASQLNVPVLRHR